MKVSNPMRPHTASSFTHKPRPISAYNLQSTQMPLVISTRRSSENPIIYTMPSQSKGMGAQIEKEELYEQNMHLKKRNNKLKADLDEAKSTIVKKDIELRKKEKIIEDLSKENVQIVQEENFEKAKESTLVTLIKRKYYEMKKNYDKVVKDNEVLKANVKLTKIKEIKVETEILEKELSKMKNLYNHIQDQNKSNLNEINQLQSFQHEYFKQHQLICSLRDNYEKSKEDCKHFNEELSKMREKCSQKDANCRKLLLENEKLKSKNEKYLSEKQRKEKNAMKLSEMQQKMTNAYKDIAKYKSLYESEKMKGKLPTTKDNVITKIENEKSNLNGSLSSEEDDLEILQNIKCDLEIRLSIYEDFLTKKGFEPYKILKSKNYDGVLNSNTMKMRKEQKVYENENENQASSITKQSTNSYYIPNNELYLSLFIKEENVFKLFKYTFEGNKVTSEYLNELLAKIVKEFENKDEASKDEFLAPFINSFVSLSKISQTSEIFFTSYFFNNILETAQNDTNIFFEKMQVFNDSVINYSQIMNEKEINEQLQKMFSPVKKDLLKYLNDNQLKENADYIDYIVFDYIINNKIKLTIHSELYDYILFKMKENLPEGTSLFALNTQFIRSLISNIDEASGKHSSQHSSNEVHNENDVNKETHITEENEKQSNTSSNKVHSNRNEGVEVSNKYQEDYEQIQDNHQHIEIEERTNKNVRDEDMNNGRFEDMNYARVEENEFEHGSHSENHVMNKSVSQEEIGKIFTAMVYNEISFDKFFEDDIEDNFDNERKIPIDKFFKKMETLHLNLTQKEKDDFIKTYRMEDDKSMLDIDRIKEKFSNINIDKMPKAKLNDDI